MRIGGRLNLSETPIWDDYNSIAVSAEDPSCVVLLLLLGWLDVAPSKSLFLLYFFRMDSVG